MAFTTHTYEHDPKHESYGLEAAEALGLDPATVFKTLVADVDGKLTVAIVPVERQLDLKALAKAVKGKRAQMADVKLAERTTGYVAGGISPLGQRKALPTVLDESALEHAAIHVCGGRRGLEIELAPHDLQRLTRATVAPISGSPSALSRMTSAAFSLVTNCGPVGISSPLRGKTP